MDIEAVPIPKQLTADSPSRGQLLSLISELWDTQPVRREAVSAEETKRIAEARRAFRVGNLLHVQSLLQDLHSPEALNLRGVMHEARGEHADARRLYQLALAEDRGLFAAEMNLRRSFELWEFGESKLPFAL